LLAAGIQFAIEKQLHLNVVKTKDQLANKKKMPINHDQIKEKLLD